VRRVCSPIALAVAMDRPVGRLRSGRMPACFRVIGGVFWCE
jgi:hypothetical protein